MAVRDPGYSETTILGGLGNYVLWERFHRDFHATAKCHSR